MLTRQQRTLSGCIIALAIAFCLSSVTWAQEPERPSSDSSFLGNIAKQVIFDPTTYAPAAIIYDATMRDWNTSQPLFRNGFVEKNPRYTISGLPNDTPLSYQDGKRRIVKDAFLNLQVSLVNNFTDRIFERALMERYPNHRRMVRTVGWIERISVGAYMSYVFSEQHYRQAVVNQEIARTMGYR